MVSGLPTQAGPTSASIAHAQGRPAAPRQVQTCDLFPASASRVQTRQPVRRAW